METTLRDSDNNNRKTRLCFFNTTHHWGGGEKWHFETASYLASRGHMVLFVVRTGGDLHKRLANHQEIKVVPIAVSQPQFPESSQTSEIDQDISSRKAPNRRIQRLFRC